MKKILIVGGGSKLAKCFNEIYNEKSISLSREECDVTSEESIKKAVLSCDCKYVLNCAAMTDVVECEQKPLECFSINTTAVYLLNKVCLQYDRKLIHISSDYALKPVNNYGWSKYLSENVVDKKFLVIRTNFYNKETFIVKNLLEGKETNVYTDVYFNPISINKLANEIYSNMEKTGILNLFTSRKISYFKFAHIFCEVFGLNKELISPVVYKDNGKVNRPNNSYIKTDKNLDIKVDLTDFKKFYENRS